MTIDNEQQAEQAILAWRSEPLAAQRRYLRQACESLELSGMYYEQKGNELGVARVGRCLALITARQREVEGAGANHSVS